MAVIKKTPAEIEAMKAAGRLSAAVLREVGARCVPGMTTLELDEFAEDYIRSHGGTPTFKGYGGFPGSICASINEQVVHGIPSSKVRLKSGDIISIDVGATVDGWAGDNAWTFAVGKVAPDVKRLLNVTEECMWAGISAARPGNKLGDIGHAVQTHAEAHGYGVVRDLTGHGIGREMHEDPSVPNFGEAGHGVRIRQGMTFCIEPMIAMGRWQVHELSDGWTIVTNDHSPAAHYEHTIAVTNGLPELLTLPDFRWKDSQEGEICV